MRTLTKETRDRLSPELALHILKEGNLRFINNLKANRNLLQQVNETSDGQYPFATILSCMDSRTSAELIFDQGLGDIFSIRVAGNILNDDIVGSIEFGTKVVGTKIVLVLGHTKCGAITGACNNVQLGKLTGLLEKIKPAVELETTTHENRTGENPDFVNKVTELNVHRVMELLRKESPVVAEMERADLLKIAGGVYDVDTGKVEFFED